MKKTINLKSAIIAAFALFVLIVVATLLWVNGIFGSNAKDAPTNLPIIELKVGKYMHASGDKTKYIEIFDDKTLQIVGYDFFEDTVYRPENKEYFENLSEEGWERETAELAEMTKEESLRRPYMMSNEYSPGLFFNDSIFTLTLEGEFRGKGIRYIDENTFEINDLNIYVYSEE